MFAPDTVDSITSSLTKTVGRLRELAKKQEANQCYNLDLAKEYRAKAEAAGEEAYKAETIADKINSLLTV